MKTDLTNKTSETANIIESEKQSLERLSELKQSLLITFDLDENNLLWSAIPLRRRNDSQFIRDKVDLGYSQFQKLSVWFREFWESTGNYNHQIRLFVSGSEILLRCFMIPVVPKSELTSIVKAQARQNYPFDLERGLFGWKIVGQTEWAGGPKYEVFSHALDEHWHGWLDELFGDKINNLHLITSGGQYFEQLLSRCDSTFTSCDSYLIKLKGETLQTGFYHKGHLEFFRQATIESLGDNSGVSELRKILGTSSDDEDFEIGLQLNDLRIIINDALDYYYGQFGQRNIESIYLCLPDSYTTKISEFAKNTFTENVINICSENLIQENLKSTGLTENITEYAEWVSLIPVKKLKSSPANLIPKEIKKKICAIRNYSYSLTALFLMVAIITTLSVLQIYKVNKFENEFKWYQAGNMEAESIQLLNSLSAYKQKVEIIKANTNVLNKEKTYYYVNALKLLSLYSTPDIRLNNATLYTSPDNSLLELRISGLIISSNNKQEAELYTYLTKLKQHPLTSSVAVVNKRTSSQFGKNKLVFEIEVIII